MLAWFMKFQGSSSGRAFILLTTSEYIFTYSSSTAWAASLLRRRCSSIIDGLNSGTSFVELLNNISCFGGQQLNDSTPSGKASGSGSQCDGSGVTTGSAKAVNNLDLSPAAPVSPPRPMSKFLLSNFPAGSEEYGKFSLEPVLGFSLSFSAVNLQEILRGKGFFIMSCLAVVEIGNVLWERKENEEVLVEMSVEVLLVRGTQIE